MKQDWQQQLQHHGYIFDTDVQIWRRPDYQGIDYNDGDEIETRIAKAIAGAQDISVLSPELRQHCTDWASLYHLSSARANLMRPFAHVFAAGASVLEVGAGCGAITRYMGECGTNVLALEGTPRRAAIARSRTRDLANVTVLSERFNHFAPPADSLFDVITLIGVLEYANLFTPSSNPHLSMLQRVRQLLKPDGVLIIAIENQLGLKYFAGAPEDHLAQPMYGLEGRYQANQPQTFGLVVIKGLLQEAGFVQNQFMSPLPDYKLPTSIITESGFEHPQFDSSALAWQCARNDPQLPTLTNFSLELTWPEIDKNGLALDLANSFLIVAMPTVGPLTIDASVLAYHYSAGRKPQFCKATQFIEQADHIELHVKRMVAPEAGTVNGDLLNQHIELIQPYTRGELLSKRFVKLVSQDKWTLAQLQAYLRTWLDIVQKHTQRFGGDLDITSATVQTLLPGMCIDCIAQNIILLDDGESVFIDEEWCGRQPVTLGHLIFRQVLMLLNSIRSIGVCEDQLRMTRLDFVQHAYRLIGLVVSDQNLVEFNLLEANIQVSVAGTSLENNLNWQPHTLLNTIPNNSQLALNDLPHNLMLSRQREEDLFSRLKALHKHSISLNEHIANPELQIIDQQGKIDALIRDNDAIRQSTSWRLTAPLRTVLNIIPAPLKKHGRRLIKAIYWVFTPWNIPSRIKHIKQRNTK